jgi:hypothetical protein
VAEIYHARDVPPELCTTLGTTLTNLANTELAGREYDKTRTRAKQKYIRLPAPTLKDLDRTKRHRILSYTEQRRVYAVADDPLKLRIRRMAYLNRYGEPESKVLLFELDATVPVRGLVQYRIPDRLSATAKYRAVVHLRATGEIPTRKTGASLSFDAPKLLVLHVRLDALDLSNDVLSAMRGTIRDVLNHELADRREHITAKANQAVAKAVKTREFTHPALKLLALP